MKLLKAAIVAAVSGLLAGTVSTACADDSSYTYVFEAVPIDDFLTPSRAFDRSTITIQGDTITSWNLMDASTAPAIVLNPGNSSVNLTYTGITSADANTWSGWFEIGTPASDLPALFFLGSSDGAFPPDGLGRLDDNLELDPFGNWTAPDALNSLQLLTLALGSLAASRLFFRRPTLAAVSIRRQ